MWDIVLGKLQELSRQANKKATWAATNKATGLEVHMPFEETLTSHEPKVLDVEL